MTLEHLKQLADTVANRKAVQDALRAESARLQAERDRLTAPLRQPAQNRPNGGQKQP